MYTKRILFLLGIIFILTACSPAAGSTAAGAVHTYVEALVAKNSEVLLNNTCLDWEAEAHTELASFDGVAIRLEGLFCEQSGLDGEFTLVSCDGNIIATYAGEDKPLDLSANTYLAVEEDDVWRMCGYR